MAERSGPGDVFLRKRLRDALLRINRELPAAAVEEALRKLSSTDAVLAIDRNQVHYFLVNGIELEYAKNDGTIGHTNVRILDRELIDNNDWLAVNQFSVAGGHHHRRPDIVPSSTACLSRWWSSRTPRTKMPTLTARISRSRRTSRRSRRSAMPTRSASSPTARRFLDLVRHFIVFEDDQDSFSKKLAGYHQFHAVRQAVEATAEAAGKRGDRGQA